MATVIRLPRSPLPMLKAEQATAAQVAIARWQMQRERAAIERQLNCVLVECAVCQSTLAAEDVTAAYGKLEAHMARWHQPQGA